MGTQAYPGQGLSLSQLILALNEEIKLTMFSSSYVVRKSSEERHAQHLLPSFTFDQVSQLDQDVSTPMATIREWKNSFVCVNRIPLEILSLIPTYLTCDNDRLRASFVCRLWRRAFLQRADLWSKLSLSKSDACLRAFLERAKGSALDILVNCPIPDDIMALVSSHTKQIRSLGFVGNDWTAINRFSKIDPESIPLLHTISFTMSFAERIGLSPHGPHPPLFRNAINLKVFCFRSSASSLGSFLFPNLTRFEFLDLPGPVSSVSHLLDFLEASPTLRMVSLTILGNILFQGIPQERVVVLPNVEELALKSRNCKLGYKIATHLSCPSARDTKFTYDTTIPGAMEGRVFPTSVSLDTILRHFARSPAEEVVLRVEITPKVKFVLTFRSSDDTRIGFCFCFFLVPPASGDIFMPLTGVYYQLFTQATQAIQDHPQLANVKRLSICHGVYNAALAQISHIANEAGRLFKSLGPLDELSILSCDPRPYLHSFLDLSYCHVENPVVFPQVKELTVSHPEGLCDEECQAAIVMLAMSQHAGGIPFERVVIRLSADMLGGMEEKLRQWVSSVECHFNQI